VIGILHFVDDQLEVRRSALGQGDCRESCSQF
jgi:hypothetical protein